MREFTPRTTGTLRYTFSLFQVEETPARDAHFSRAGLAYVLSPTIRLSADAGPLLLERADGSTEITVGGTRPTRRNSSTDACRSPTTGTPD